MKNIKKLNRKLQKLESQKINLDSLENVSVFQFAKYKKIVLEKEKIKKQINVVKLYGNEIKRKYEDQIDIWINNLSINCRKFSRLEKKEEYNRDMQLYKLGLLNKRPLSPIVQKLKDILPKVDISKFNYFKKISNSYNNFKSNILPQKINKFAVNTAKVTIKGYRNIKSDIRFIRNYINSKNSVKYLKSVLQKANFEIQNSQLQNMYKTKEEMDFRKSLRVDTSMKTKVRTNYGLMKSDKKVFELEI